jgi:hypothetical protein
LAVSSGACSIRTFSQATSSSSAITIGSMVLMPWPISGFFDMMVTMPSGAMRTKAFSAAVSPAASEAAAIAVRASGGKVACSNKPPPAATVAFRNARRECVAAGGNWASGDLAEELAVIMVSTIT